MQKLIKYTFLVFFLLSTCYLNGNIIENYCESASTISSDPIIKTPLLPSLANPHFITIWDGQNPYLPMTIIITSAQIDGVDLLIDDEIAVFDTNAYGVEICVGTGVVTSTIDASNPLVIVTSADDPLTPYIDGFTSGNTIIFRVWNEYEQIELTNISTGFDPSFDEEFLSLGTAIVTISTSTPNGLPVIDTQAAAVPDTVVLPNTVDLSVSASDPDSDVLTYSWIKLTGPGNITFSVNNTSSSDLTTASFSADGEYEIRVLVNDDEDTVSSDVDVVVVATIPSSRVVENITIIDGQTECYDATSTITVAGSGTTVDILSGGEATFIAGERIHWKPGFHAHEGSYAHGYITTNEEYCSQQQPLVAVQTQDEEEVVVTPDFFVDEDESVKIYPNPTLGKFTIDFMGKTKTADITLMNFQGNQVLESRCVEQNKKEINISHVPGGIYVVVIVMKTQTQIQIIKRKIIKNY